MKRMRSTARAFPKLLVLLLALGMVAAACGDDEAEDLGTVRVNFNWLVDPGFGGYYVALDQGYYTDEGIDVVIEHGGPNVPNPVQTVDTGAADIGIAALNVIAEAVAGGADYVIVATRFQENPLGISSLPSDPVTSAADIVGADIGGGAFDAVFLDALLTLNGLEPGSYNLVPVGFDPSPVAEGLVKGQVNYMTSHPVILDAMGVDNVATAFADMGLNMYADMIFVRRSFLEENRDAVVAFVRGSIKGWETMVKDPELAFDLMFDNHGAEDAGIDRASLSAIHAAQVELMTSALTFEKGLFYMDLALIEGPMYDAVRATGLENPPPASDIVDLSILEDVYEGKTSLLDD